MRDKGGLIFIHGDMLGSASMTTDSNNGSKISEMRYKPFGEPRLLVNQMNTDRTFTGQRVERGFGNILDYGARYYDPYIGRFISADTIVPRPGDPQAFNRYTYARANPLRRIDPFGHADGIIENIGGFIYGFTAGLSEANNPYIPGWVQQATDSLTVQDSTFAAGRAAGNVAGIVQGLAEVVAGGSADVGGGGLCATGAGCVLGAPALVVGTAIATHGLAVAANGVNKLLGTATLMAKSGSGGDPRETRVYEASPKHGPSRWADASPMDLDDNTAQRVLDNGSKQGKQIYGYHDGDIYTFQQTGGDKWHGYKTTARQSVPTKYLKELLESDQISQAKYNSFVKSVGGK